MTHLRLVTSVSDEEVAKELSERLEKLDFSDFDALINYFDDLATLSERVEVQLDKLKIVRAFAEHGLLSDMNCGLGREREFGTDERTRLAAYTIGFGLKLVKQGEVTFMFHNFARNWRRKFGDV